MNLTNFNGTASLGNFLQNGFPKEMVLITAIFASLLNFLFFILYNISKATSCARGYVVLSMLETLLNFFLTVTYVLKYTTDTSLQSTIVDGKIKKSEDDEDSAYYFHGLFFTCILTRNFWRTVMSITSCCAILRPFWQFKYNIFNKKHQTISIVCILAASVLLSICYFVSFKFLPESSQVAIGRQICQSLVMSVLPGMVMLITAVLVVKQLKKRSRQLTQQKSCKASSTDCETYCLQETKSTNSVCVALEMSALRITGESDEMESDMQDPQSCKAEQKIYCERTREKLIKMATANANYVARDKQNRLAAMIVVSLAVGFIILEFVGDVWIFILQQMLDKSLDADVELPLPDFLVALDSCLNIFVLLVFNRTFRSRLWRGIVEKMSCHR